MNNSRFAKILSSTLVKRDELIKRLVSFVCYDTLLYLGEDKVALAKIPEVNKILCTNFVCSKGINVADENIKQQDNVLNYLQGCSLEKNLFIYLAATEVRSVLLAILFVEKKISAEDVFSLAFAEELGQQKEWGKTTEVCLRHQQVIDRLKELEQVLNERSLS